MIPVYFAVLRYLSLSIGVATAFVQVGMYVRFLEVENVAFLMVVTSYAVFISWFDAGLSRPLYTTLRKKFLENSVDKTEILSATYIYVLLGVASSLVFCGVIYLLSGAFDVTLSVSTILMFGLSVAISTGISFFRSLYSAIDEYSRFELIEVGKRFSNLGTTFFIIYDGSFFLTALVILLCNAILYLEAVRFLVKKFSKKLSHHNFIDEIRRLVVAHKKETSQYFVFIINETLIYNWGYLITPFLLSASNVVMFGLWMRLYSGMATFSRSIADITIHSITKNYISGRIGVANSERKKTLVLSVLMSISMVTVFALLADPIMKYWVDGKYAFDNSLLLALLVLLTANSIQHVAGTVLVSIGNHFKRLRNMSAVLCVAVLVGTTAGTFVFSAVSAYVLVFSLIYMLGAFWYEGVSRSVFEG